MKISIGADERLTVVEAALELLEARGDEIAWYGPKSGEAEPWPQVARRVAEDVSEGRAEEGILFCWTGTGVSIAANKVHGVRAAVCTDGFSAALARRWRMILFASSNSPCEKRTRTKHIRLQPSI